MEHRLAQLEQGAARREERWANHDKHAETRQQEMREHFLIVRNDIVKIYDKLDGLGCSVHAERLSTFEKALKDIKDEKHNTAKAAQWRVGIIVGVVIAVINILAKVFIK